MARKKKPIKDSYLFYRSFYEATKLMDYESLGKLYLAINEYALNQKLIDMDANILPIFTLIKPQIDANYKKWLSGYKGGNPIGNVNNPRGKNQYSERESSEKADKQKLLEDNHGITIGKPNEEGKMNTDQCINVKGSMNNVQGINVEGFSDGKAVPVVVESDGLYSCYPSGLREALADFEDMRKQIKAPLTPRAREILLKKLHKYGNGDADTMVEILNRSTVSCWKDIYPLNETKGKKKRKVDILDL